MQRLIQQLIPFLYLGIMIVIFVLGLMFLSYILIFGAIIGSILFIINWIRQKFFSSRQINKRKSSGRIIDHDSLH